LPEGVVAALKIAALDQAVGVRVVIENLLVSL
jgi:hypothetical protein